jgi:hypothetical protein
MHTALHGFFNMIAQEHYNKFTESLNQYNELTNNNEQWDILSKTTEQNQLYFSLFREKQKHAIISVVFLVMSVEGLIHEYGFSSLGEHKINELDQGKFIDKIINIYTEVTGQQFPKDNQLYQNLNDLISVRNTLVHSKSIEINVEELMGNDKESEEKYLAYINSVLGNSKTKYTKQKLLDEVLRKSHNVYNDLYSFFSNQNKNIPI